LVVGANRDGTGGDFRGAIHVLLLNANGTVKSSTKIASGIGGGPTLANSDHFGTAVGSLGDLDGDGVADLAVGADGDDTGGSYRGAVHVLFLNPTVANANPIITSPNTANVPENTTTVLSVTATDADVPPQTITFSIVGGVDQSRFSITGGGALSFIAAPNFEAPSDSNSDNVYVVTVQASDGVGGTATQTINVTVTPVNEFNPVFTSTNTASVPENTTAVKTVTATDADLPAQTITFSVVGGADIQKLGITAGGALSFHTAPNFEAPTDTNVDNVYDVFVQASDGQGGTTLQVISVTVTPVNDFSPVFTSSSTISVPENTTIATLVSASDQDEPDQMITYSMIGGVDQSWFGLASNGILTFLVPPNFESPTDSNGDNVYVVTVQASDGNGGTATQTINVTVTPVNEFNPVFTSTNTASVPENTTTVKTVTATDADLPASAVTFSIVGGADQSKFSITSGGALSFLVPPDFEKPHRCQWGQYLHRDGAGERWPRRRRDADHQRNSDGVVVGLWRRPGRFGRHSDRKLQHALGR
jgi:serralysin